MGTGRSFLNFFTTARSLLLLLVILIAFGAIIGTPLPVNGQSMEPNFHTHEIVIVERLSYLNGSIQRGDVVAARFPADSSHTKLIKRVIGLPGDTISIDKGHLSVNGRPLIEPYNPIYGAPPYQETGVTLPDNEYFLVGDNRPGSSDSRLWGPVQRSDIQGRVSFIILPLQLAQYIDHVFYTF